MAKSSTKTAQKRKRQFFIDMVFLIISISFAVWFAESGLTHEVVGYFSLFPLLGVFIAGMFFTSVFTTAPAIVLLGDFAHTTPLGTLALVGGLGAVVGDYFLFRFVKGHVSDDIDYLLSFARKNRFSAIFKTRLFRYFVPFIGALIIASPFPDELGIAMMGVSKMSNRAFFVISFIMNMAGIAVIGWLATAVV
jgi:uncharacterized membrane protein YdjX (TVP38/TMEM64 family)